MSKSASLGTEPINKLLWQQAAPAAVGILVMSIYGIVDTIFVGRYVGAIAIGAITVVLPITFLISSIGMAFGIGGSSIISRALGDSDKALADKAFGNLIALTVAVAVVALITGVWFQKEILQLFGGKGDILSEAQTYFSTILIGIPFLIWAMMSTNVIRAQGAPKMAMMAMIVPAVVNLILDPILIIGLDMGLKGAALATTFSYICSAAFAFWFFIFGKSEVHIKSNNMRLELPIVKEIFSLGSVTFARQGVISILAIILNNTLFSYGAELAVSVYGIIQRVMMFANFPVRGITQGFLPIAGYNYGAQKWDRVRAIIQAALSKGTLIAFGLFIIILSCSSHIVSLFTTDEVLIDLATPALQISFLATPLILFQLIGSAYFQAIGRAVPALFLTLTKQGFCLIPLLLILPHFFGLNGVWYAFPIADVIAASICFYYLRKQMNALDTMDKQQQNMPVAKVEG